jgi:hypothetical protein
VRHRGRLGDASEVLLLVLVLLVLGLGVGGSIAVPGLLLLVVVSLRSRRGGLRHLIVCTHITTGGSAVCTLPSSSQACVRHDYAPSGSSTMGAPAPCVLRAPC